MPWSLGALVLGSPVAHLLGVALRRVRRIAAHAVAFTALGAAIGMATTALAVVAPWTGLAMPPTEGYALPCLVVCLAATAAVPLGWRFAVWRAFHLDGEGRAESSHAVPKG